MKFPALIPGFARGLAGRVAALRDAKGLPALSSVPGSGGWVRIFESFAGAWQSHVVAEPLQNLLTFSGVFSCVSLISGDIAKLLPMLKQAGADGIRIDVEPNSPFWRVLRKPNHYQNRIQFWRLWILSKLLHGNTYVLKVREEVRGVVKKLHILDPTRVTPMVTMSGDVYYQLSADNLSGISLEMTVPASEIIHDRGATLYHPLVGVPAIVACAYSATQGIKIQRNSATFFKNMSMPSGMLTAPKTIDDQTAARLKKHFEENYSGSNLGRIAVAGDGLEFKVMTMPAEQAQLIEQLKWTVEDVARCFHVPLYKIGGTVPANNTVEVLNQIYYTDCLQELIECAELCLDEGLELPQDKGYGVEFDLDGLLRMDTAAQITTLAEAVKGTIMVPNEARRKMNLPPKKGGDALYLQQQNFSLEALAKRDAKDDPFETNKPPAPPADSTPPAGESKKAADLAMEFAVSEITRIGAAALSAALVLAAENKALEVADADR